MYKKMVFSDEIIENFQSASNNSCWSSYLLSKLAINKEFNLNEINLTSEKLNKNLGVPSFKDERFEEWHFISNVFIEDKFYVTLSERGTEYGMYVSDFKTFQESREIGKKLITFTEWLIVFCK